MLFNTYLCNHHTTAKWWWDLGHRGDPSTDVPGACIHSGDCIISELDESIFPPNIDESIFPPNIDESIFPLDTFRSIGVDHTVFHKWIIKQTNMLKDEKFENVMGECVR